MGKTVETLGKKINRDQTVIAVPHDKLSSMYSDVKECSDLPPLLLAQIQHFFENYKALELGNWVKKGRWGTAIVAREEIRKSVDAYVLK
jgi:inorganic pyrophosphatase